MKGFIVFSTYRIEGKDAFVHLYGRLENDETFFAKIKTKPYFFIKKTDLKKAQKLNTGFSVEETKLKDFDEEIVVKIILDNPKNVADLRDFWHENEIRTYEADVRFVYRYLIDNELRGSLDIEGDYEPGEKHDITVDRVYTNPKIKPIQWTPKLKVLSFDIESNKDTNELYCISLYDGKYKNVLIKKEGKFKGAETFKDEKSLLERFQALVLELNPDIIIGWNVIDFDIDFLEKKFKENKVPFVLGRTKEKCTLRRYDDFMRDSTATFPGRQILDGIHLLKSSFIKLNDYRLNTAATEFLGETKLITTTGKDKYQEIVDNFENYPQKLIDYNLKDSILAYDILEKSGVLALTIQRSLLTGMQLDRVKASVASLDNLYLSELRKRGYVAFTRFHGSRDRRITGGYVMDSKPGIFDYVIVCDFKSLYPSIMKTFNIDPLAYIPPEKEKKFKDYIEAPNGAKFKREIGILPGMLQRLGDKRNEAKKKKNMLESNAIKVLMNSIFGVLANPSCRFYSFEMSNAITHFGQHFIKFTAEKVSEKGYEVIYSDTDSLFIDLKTSTYDEAITAGEDIVNFINTFFSKHIKEKYGVTSYLELEFEKVYKIFFMPKVRGGEGGAKKRYAGLKYDGKKEEMEFVGLEFVRRDWTELAKIFQLSILDKIFHKKNPTNYIKKFVGELKSGKYDDLLVYRKALRKQPDEYTKTTPPHVKAARLMKEIESNIIEYVMTVDGPEPTSNVKHSLDYDHYIDKQLKPIADSVLLFYDSNFEDVLDGNKQMQLGGFK